MRMPRALTQKGNLKQPTRQDVISWVSKAWAWGSKLTSWRSLSWCVGSQMLWMALKMILCVDKVPAVDANSIESESADEEDTEDAEDPTDSDVDDLDPFHVFPNAYLIASFSSAKCITFSGI